MKAVEILQKEYLPEQEKLIDILRQHVHGCMPEFPVVFKAPRTKKPRKFIDRIPCKTIGGKGEYHLISMEVVDFIRLMVKSGIKVKIYDSDEAALQKGAPNE